MKKRIQILIIVILYALMFVPLSAQTPHTISGIVKDEILQFPFRESISE